MHNPQPYHALEPVAPSRTIKFLAPRKPQTDAELRAWQARADRIAAKFACYAELVFSETPTAPGTTPQPGAVIIDDSGQITGTVDSSSHGEFDFYF
jgi:hypothetical protein